MRCGRLWRATIRWWRGSWQHVAGRWSSREALRLRGEQEFRLEHLPLPDQAQQPSGSMQLVDFLSRYAAVELFVERAHAVKHGFTLTPDNAPAVAEICRYLDGLPLAIELAAARVKLFSPQVLLERLTGASGRTLHLLKGGVRDLPERHQTLRDTIEWSYDLLDSSEQTLFRRLATFEAIEVVCDQRNEFALDVLDGLTSLVDKSLLRQIEQSDGESRFFLLRTIQEYALERLEASGEVQAMHEAHAPITLPSPKRPSGTSMARKQPCGWSASTRTMITCVRHSSGSSRLATWSEACA